jgi:hypothetical protein
VALDTGDPLAPLRRDTATAGIFSDFDGTLSPIVDDPELAEPVAGVPNPPLCRYRTATLRNHGYLGSRVVQSTRALTPWGDHPLEVRHDLLALDRPLVHPGPYRDRQVMT